MVWGQASTRRWLPPTLWIMEHPLCIKYIWGGQKPHLVWQIIIQFNLKHLTHILISRWYKILNFLFLKFLQIKMFYFLTSPSKRVSYWIIIIFLHQNQCCSSCFEGNHWKIELNITRNTDYFNWRMEIRIILKILL